jgi:hypothetical protein
VLLAICAWLAKQFLIVRQLGLAWALMPSL